MPARRYRLLALLLSPALALAQPPEYWPQHWPPGWYPQPYYPMPPPSTPPAQPPQSSDTSEEEAAPEVGEDTRTSDASADGAPSERTSAEPAGDEFEALTRSLEDETKEQDLTAPTIRDDTSPGILDDGGYLSLEPGFPVTTEALSAESETAVTESELPTGEGQSVPTVDVTPEEVAQTVEDEVDPAVLHQEALQAMRGGDYAEAFCIWRPLARAGDAQALFSLGWMYHNGYGLAIDDKKTLALWQQAAEQDYADAAFALGMLFSFGDGNVRRDLPRAVEHYLQAIRLGHEDARQMLGDLIIDNPRAVADIVDTWGADEWNLLGSRAEVSVNRANVRQGPSTQTKIVAKLVSGDRVLALGRRGGWIYVMLPEGRLAWIYGELLETEPQAAQVSLSASSQASNK